MKTLLNNFDPISFLDINVSSLSSQDITKLRSALNSKMGEYILLKFSEYLTEGELTQVTDTAGGQEMLERLETFIPNLKEKIIEELKNFKKDFHAINKVQQHV